MRTNENNGVKGRVHTLQQRKGQKLVGLEHLRSRDIFDVEFSPSEQTLQTTNYNMAATSRLTVDTARLRPLAIPRIDPPDAIPVRLPLAPPVSA